MFANLWDLCYICAVKTIVTLRISVMRKKILLVLFGIAISISLLAQSAKSHLVQPGETLYSIARQYGVTVEQLQAANPKVEGTNIASGSTLLIPPPAAEVKAVMPSVNTQQPSAKELNRTVGEELKTSTMQRIRKGTDANIALLLPFNLDAKTRDDDNYQMRSVEFYQGFLMAVNEAQKSGQRVRINSYDLGSQKLDDILSASALKDCDLIIAPSNLNHVRQIAAFGDKYGVPVVSPFSFDASLTESYELLMQLNTSKVQLYPTLCDDLVLRFRDYVFVFMKDSLSTEASETLVPYLRDRLVDAGLRMRNFEFGQDIERIATVDSLLDVQSDKVIYIPVNSGEASLRRMCVGLKQQRDRVQQTQVVVPLIYGGPDRALLGYPEWVQYTRDLVSYFYDLNVFMFSKIYVNPFDERVNPFYDDFKYWYGKEMMKINPKYGMLGYDVGLYFLRAIRNHKNFLTYIRYEEAPTLQTAIRFGKEDNGGYLNRAVYLVHFDMGGRIEKIFIK